METVRIESSSDGDDSDDYLNSVARLKALKKHTKVKVAPKDEEIEIKESAVDLPEQNTSENPNCLPTISPEVHGSMILRSRSNNQPFTNWSGQGRRSRGRRRRQNEAPDWSDSDLQIVSVEGVTESYLPVSQPSILNDSFTFNDDVVLVDDASPGVDDDNYEMVVKVLWRSKMVHRLNIQKNETFRKVFQFFAEKEGIPINKILLMRKEQAIAETDTPASIDLSIIDILEGGIIKTSSNQTNNAPDKNLCTIKVQTTSKKSLLVTIKKDEEFEAVFEKCAKELEVDQSKIKLYFDGEAVDRHDSPDSLDIEDEACFDLRVSS